MNIIPKLPDDIILHIYTKCLKRYRLYEGKLIKLINLDKYKFLEKYIYRKIIRSNKLNSINDEETIYNITYQLINICDINRKDSHIDNDMICIEFTIKNSSIIFDVQQFRLKKIQDMNIKKIPSIYYKGDYKDYDWEVINYTFEI
jgi:hypothetical protein